MTARSARRSPSSPLLRRATAFVAVLLVVLVTLVALGTATSASGLAECSHDGSRVRLALGEAAAAQAVDGVGARAVTSCCDYDDAVNLARTSSRLGAYRWAPNTTGGGGDDCEPECVQAPIIPSGAVLHVYSKHYPGGAENFPGELTFYEHEDLYDLLDAAELVTPWEDGENCKRHVHAGRLIGTPIGSSMPTSIYTVITSRPGVLVTAFPGAG